MMGERLGPYEIVAKIGEGGMGAVYRARDPRLGRDVAIKTLLPELTGDAERLHRFRREAQILASLNHPNIAAIHGIEDLPGSPVGPFLVMELVEGPTLADLIDGSAPGAGSGPRARSSKLSDAAGEQTAARAASAPADRRLPLPTADAIDIATQIAEALRAAHERGVIHRDLKPGNVKVRPDGVVKVLDFGLAKALDPQVASSETIDVTRAPAVTHIGAILGTAAYMSPEQARGLDVDQRADIWAFGCVLYEMLTGRQAFEGATFSDTVAAIIGRDPDWTRTAPTPPRVQRLLRRCLAKDPRRRLSSAADARLELEEPDDVVVPAAQHVAPPRPNRAIWISVAALALLAGLGLGWLASTHVGRASASTPLTHTTVGVKPAVSLLGANPYERFAFARSRPSRRAIALSPDARTLAFTAQDQRGIVGLYVRSLASADAALVPGVEGADGPFFSPDGRWVGYWANGAIWKVAVSGGPPVKVCETAEPLGSTWASDDRIVFATTTIKAVPANGGTPSVMTKLEAGERSHVLPEVLPGGKWLLYTVLPTVNDWDHTHVVAQSLESAGERHNLLDGAADARYAPSGHLVFMRTGRLMAAPFDTLRAALTGGEVGVLDDVMQAAGTTAIQLDTGTGQFAFSETGTLAYVGGGIVPDFDGTLRWVRRDGSAEPIKTPARSWFSPRLSPDGRHIAIGTLGLREQALWRYDIAEGSMVRLTSEGHVEQPIWSPDGQRITFGMSLNGPYNMYSIPADGSAAPTRLTTSANMQFAGAWTPDGRELLLVDAARLHVLKPGSEPKPLYETKYVERMADLSPDGRWLAYVSNETGRSEVFVRAYPSLTGKRQVSTDGGIEPAWSKNGRKLVYVVPDPAPHADMATFLEVDVALGDQLTFGRPHTLFDTRFDPATIARSWDMTPDAERFLIVLDSYPPAVEAPREIQYVQGWFDDLRARTAAHAEPR
jgi:serine/threonine-protein kinase